METLAAVNAGDDVPVQCPAGPAYRADLTLKRADVDCVKGHSCALKPFSTATIVVGSTPVAATESAFTAVNAATASSHRVQSSSSSAATAVSTAIAAVATAGIQDPSCTQKVRGDRAEQR